MDFRGALYTAQYFRQPYAVISHRAASNQTPNEQQAKEQPRTGTL